MIFWGAFGGPQISDHQRLAKQRNTKNGPNTKKNVIFMARTVRFSANEAHLRVNIDCQTICYLQVVLHESLEMRGKTAGFQRNVMERSKQGEGASRFLEHSSVGMRRRICVQSAQRVTSAKT